MIQHKPLSVPMKIHNPFSSLLTIIISFLLFLTIIHKSLSTTNLNNPPQNNRATSFYMLDILTYNQNPSLSFDHDIYEEGYDTFERGIVTTFDQDIYEGHNIFGSSFIGKAQGIYVAGSSKDASSELMVAMTASFASDDEYNYKDGLRFFGVEERRSGVSESQHIAVIGGSGKYQNANGYAIVKTVNLNSTSLDGEYKLLHFNVYLDYL